MQVYGPRNPTHAYETRFQAIIRHMRAGGAAPTLSDYHFILEQFAAIGCNMGALEVFQEIVYMGLKPQLRTFGLCLQALAHRLILPTFKSQRARVIRDTVSICDILLRSMLKHEVPLNSVNLDLTLRILRETLDLKGFELLLKIGYGVDLSFPDHLVQESITPERKLLPTPHPFSTDVLNTTVNFLGLMGQTSKMVQAFEVLSQPLQHVAFSFDDDDDACAPNPPESQAVELPCATPNTTTYNQLLKHICAQDHAVFARHYLKQAVWLDNITDRTLRGLLLLKTPLIIAPRFAFNKATILPVFGMCNRKKNVELMRRVMVYLRRVIRRKKSNIVFYSGLQAERDGFVTPPAKQVSKRILRHPPTPVLDLDLDANDEPQPPPVKYFDLDLHVSILRKDLAGLENLYEHASDVMSRTLQRVKERLGRRIWAGKDVFLITQEGRQKVSRQTWIRIARFKTHPKYDGDASQVEASRTSAASHTSERHDMPTAGTPGPS